MFNSIVPLKDNILKKLLQKYFAHQIQNLNKNCLLRITNLWKRYINLYSKVIYGQNVAQWYGDCLMHHWSEMPSYQNTNIFLTTMMYLFVFLFIHSFIQHILIVILALEIFCCLLAHWQELISGLMHIKQALTQLGYITTWYWYWCNHCWKCLEFVIK